MNYFNCNKFISVLKIVIGILSGFKSLVAEGIHCFPDLLTDAISIVGNYLSKKPADMGHPRDHGKIEYITSLIINVSIIILGSTFLKNSLSKENIILNIYIVSLLTPELSIEIQNKLDSDIAMSFDDYLSYLVTHEYMKNSVERTVN